MATYLQSKDLWMARRRGPNGSRRSFYAKSETEAEAKADAWDALPALPVFTVAPGSVDDFVARSVAPVKRQLSPETKAQWAWAMDKYILPVLGSMRPEDLTLGHVHLVMGQLSGRSPDTARTVRKHLFQLFRLLARDNRIPYNYVEETTVPPPQRRKPALSIVDARILYRDTRVLAVRTMVGLGAFAGLAREEMREQTFAMIRTGSVTVDKGAKGGIKYRKRTIPVPLAVARTLPASGDPWADCGEYWMGDLLARECGRLGLPVSNVHQLRHTFASALDMIGCPRSVSTRQLGHSPRNVTDGYMSASDEALEEWIERLWRHAKDQLRARGRTDVNQVNPRRRVYSKPKAAS